MSRTKKFSKVKAVKKASREINTQHGKSGAHTPQPHKQPKHRKKYLDELCDVVHGIVVCPWCDEIVDDDDPDVSIYAGGIYHNSCKEEQRDWASEQEV